MAFSRSVETLEELFVLTSLFTDSLSADSSSADSLSADSLSADSLSADSLSADSLSLKSWSVNLCPQTRASKPLLALATDRN